MVDPSPYEDNYLVHLCFHYVEKYFFFLSRNILFPAQITRVLYFLFLNPQATKEGSSSYHRSLLLFDGRWSTDPGVERWGMGTRPRLVSSRMEREDQSQHKARHRLSRRKKSPLWLFQLWLNHSSHQGRVSKPPETAISSRSINSVRLSLYFHVPAHGF